ncbi:MAG: cell division protein FtsZ [Candidatus Dojkabacteria bacterium]
MLVKPQASLSAKIKVVGVGGGGGNALNTMVSEYNIQDVEFIAVNTDAQALVNSKADTKLRIGEQITRGLGSGGNPVIGRKAAEESVDQIHEHMAGSDMVFITAGMGGGTGTGAAPIVAGIAKNLGALTVGVVTKPFHFEMKKRMDSALKGIEELRDKVDTLIVVPNQKLLESLDKNVSFLDAMKKADDVLAQAVKSISNLITQTGLINVDFADVKSVMADGGTALMGIGQANGENRAALAAKQAIESPLLEVSIDGAKGVLFNVIGGKDLGMLEISAAAEIIKDKINPEATFIFGASIDPSYEDKFEVTVLATGFDMDYQTGEFVSMMTRPGETNVQHNRGEENNFVKKPEVAKPNMMGNLQRQPVNTETDDDLESLPSFLRRRKDFSND